MVQFPGPTSEKLEAEASQSIAKFLSEKQLARYSEIRLQYLGDAALTDEAVGDALDLTEGQRKELLEIENDYEKQLKGMFDRGLSFDEFRKQGGDLAKTIGEKRNAVFSAEQKTKLDKLRGKIILHKLMPELMQDTRNQFLK